MKAQRNHRKANSPARWDELHAKEGERSWRKTEMAAVFEHLSKIVPRGARVVDVGGGRGFLAEVLRDDAGCDVEVWDISKVAVQACIDKGFRARVIDVELSPFRFDQDHIVIATECFEHLDLTARNRLLRKVSEADAMFMLSVPNNRLGPSVEPQHTVQYTQRSLGKHLGDHFRSVTITTLPGLKLPAACLFAVCSGGLKLEQS